MPLIDLTGRRFGRLTVIKRAGSMYWSNGGANPTWLCKCDCGNEKVVLGECLRKGTTVSCGCYKQEVDKARNYKHGASVTCKNERLYHVWLSMRERANNPKCRAYKWYGAKGVKVCEGWKDYTTFREWAFDNGYNPNAEYGACTLDRIDPCGDYEPNNCRWVTMTVQLKNRRKKDEART